MDGVTPESYGRQAAQLLPPGSAWTRDPESNLARLLAALGASLARAHRRGLDLFNETDAGEAFETLERWETQLGLPDGCSVQGSQTIQERVQAVLARLLDAGGMARADFLALAEVMGYPNATITEYGARRYGRARMGEPYGGEDWENAWQLNLPTSLVIERRHGRSAMGEPYRVWGDSQFECVMHKRKPAGSILTFTYGDT